jgi:hypothetical protein
MTLIREYIQKFADWVDKYTLTTIKTRWEATQRIMAAKLTILTHKTAIQLHLVAESCTICSSRSRRPLWKLLDSPSYGVWSWRRDWLTPCIVFLSPSRKILGLVAYHIKTDSRAHPTWDSFPVVKRTERGTDAHFRLVPSSTRSDKWRYWWRFAVTGKTGELARVWSFE